jgi:hypothetical protein
LSALLRNLKRVVDERAYTWTERVGKEKKEHLLATIRDRRSLSIVAQFAGKNEIIGQLSLTLPGDVRKVSHVRNLSILVVDGYRGRGVGKALMRYAVDWAKRTEGVEKIHLGVFSTNTRAMNLYKDLGFEVEGVLKRQYVINGDYVDEIVMGLFVKRRNLNAQETL